MLQQEPEFLLMEYLRDSWQATIDGFSPNYIHTGQYHNDNPNPEVILHHMQDTRSTRYLSPGPEPPKSNYRGVIQVDVWVPYTDNDTSTGPVKARRKEIENEVRRIVGHNPRGIILEEGLQKVLHLGMQNIRRTIDRDEEPMLFRTNMEVDYSYISAG